MTMFAQLIHGNIGQIFLYLVMAACRASNCSSHLLPQNRLLHAQEFFDRMFWNTLAGVSLICITCSEHFVCFRRLVTQITDVPSRSTWRTSKCRTNSSFGNNYCACHIGNNGGIRSYLLGLRKNLQPLKKHLRKDCSLDCAPLLAAHAYTSPTNTTRAEPPRLSMCGTEEYSSDDRKDSLHLFLFFAKQKNTRESVPSSSTT